MLTAVPKLCLFPLSVSLQINQLKGRYTIRMMTATRKKVLPVFPILSDRWLADGMQIYFSQIEESQMATTRLIEEVLPPLETQVKSQHSTLTQFFKFWKGKLGGRDIPLWNFKGLFLGG